MAAKKQKNVGKRKPMGKKKEISPNESPFQTSKSKTTNSSLWANFVSLIVVVIAVAMVLAQRTNQVDQAVKDLPAPDPKVSAFLEEACKSAVCDTTLILAKRTLRAKKRLYSDHELLRIPRSMQIWDLDAMRDKFIQKHLFKARHERSNNHLGNEAFLAAYLALQIQRVKQSPDGMDPLRKTYLEFLPTIEEYSSHPILWDKEEAKKVLGERSASNVVLSQHRSMIDSEYFAFEKASPRFAKMIPLSDYVAARLNVMTRSFSMGIPSEDEAVDEMSLAEELKQYKESAGIDYLDEGNGCRAMIPIADLLNHHPSISVNYRYISEGKGTQEFVLGTVRGNAGQSVDPGTELMISYGEYTDAHLFARYGFINGDGSGKTEVTIAFHHDILNLRMAPQYNLLPYSGTTESIQEYQREQILNYMAFDDGYAECIEGPESNPEGAKLKQLKLEHLMKIANSPDRWIVTLPPRFDASAPASIEVSTGMEPSMFQYSTLFEQTDIYSIESTCRLMSMINSDFGGQAMGILQDNIENNDFKLWEGNESLEFRTLVCLKRYADSESRLILMQRELTLPQLHQMIKDLGEEGFGTGKWSAYHLLYADLQSLDGIAHVAGSRLKERFSDKRENPTTEFSYRDTPCPVNSSNYLLYRN